MALDLGYVVGQYVVKFLFNALLFGDPLLPTGMLARKL